MNPFVTVYDKGHDRKPHRLDPARTRVVPLLNKGREGRTWLEHFLRHYDSLAEWTFLAQGEPHQEPGEFAARLKVRYRDTTALTREYMPHFPPRWIKDRDEVEWHGGVEVRYGRAIYQGGRSKAENEPWLRQLWPHFFAVPPPDPIEDWTYGYGAMYAVPRHRITARPIEFWRWCHDVIARPEHQVEHSWGSGYAFELIWRYLLGDADRYPVRMPEPDVARAGMLAELCPHGSGACGCGSEARRCVHPLMPDRVWRRDCLECPFKREAP